MKAKNGLVLITRSTITCPHYLHSQIEDMPTHACRILSDCEGCGAALRPRFGDCCVFCSYGDAPCPPIQEGVTCSQAGC